MLLLQHFCQPRPLLRLCVAWSIAEEHGEDGTTAHMAIDYLQEANALRGRVLNQAPTQEALFAEAVHGTNLAVSV